MIALRALGLSLATLFILANAQGAWAATATEQVKGGIDRVLAAVDNPALKGVLPKDYARPSLDKQRLGALIDLVSTIGLGDEESRKKDILGRVYEYFLSKFASAEGKQSGQFYTPRHVVKWS